MNNIEDHTLEAREVSVAFGGVKAITKLNLVIRQEEIFGLIGPNGAGKSTSVNVLTGFQRPTAGMVLLDGNDIVRFSPETIARKGVARCFQAARVFPRLTAEETVATAILSRRFTMRAAFREALELLERMGYSHLIGRLGGSLSYGDQRRLGIARALALNPHFLLMDEPAAGMNDAEAEDMIGLIRGIPGRFGCAVLLIEHNIQVVAQTCSRVLVLDGGRPIAEGRPEAILKNEAVRQAYLGS